jgi:hypothetical protein
MPVTPAQYTALCYVIDHVKTDERTEDTDVYASAAIAALGESVLTEPEKELLAQMISDYFDGLGNGDIEQEQPELYQELVSLSDGIERKLGLA